MPGVLFSPVFFYLVFFLYLSRRISARKVERNSFVMTGGAISFFGKPREESARFMRFVRLRRHGSHSARRLIYDVVGGVLTL